jgi:hypothetical protein
MSLLRSVELAGEKSWQARAWILERTHGYAQPSARLQVTQDHTHNLGGNLAQLLAGIRGRKQNTESTKPKELENGHNYIDVQPITKAIKTDMSHNSRVSTPIYSRQMRKVCQKRHQRMRTTQA